MSIITRYKGVRVSGDRKHHMKAMRELLSRCEREAACKGRKVETFYHCVRKPDGSELWGASITKGVHEAIHDALGRYGLLRCLVSMSGRSMLTGIHHGASGKGRPVVPAYTGTMYTVGLGESGTMYVWDERLSATRKALIGGRKAQKGPTTWKKVKIIFSKIWNNPSRLQEKWRGW